jgi:hypothetical protein
MVGAVITIPCRRVTLIVSSPAASPSAWCMWLYADRRRRLRAADGQTRRDDKDAGAGGLHAQHDWSWQLMFIAG